MCAKKAASHSDRIVLVGVFEHEPAAGAAARKEPSHFRLLPAPDATAYYRIPLDKAELKPEEPENGQAVTVYIEDHSTPIECVQTVAANYLKGPIASAHLGLATTAARLSAAIGDANVLSLWVTKCAT